MNTNTLSILDQKFVMETILLEICVAENMNTGDLFIKYREDLKEWRIVRVSDRRIMFKKHF